MCVWISPLKMAPSTNVPIQTFTTERKMTNNAHLISFFDSENVTLLDYSVGDFKLIPFNFEIWPKHFNTETEIKN